MGICATGARHSKSLKRCCPRTACLRQGPKIIYSYYTRCALIRDRQPTAWDDFARTAEIEVTCKPSDSSREISKNHERQVKDSFCKRSEEYNVSGGSRNEETGGLHIHPPCALCRGVSEHTPPGNF